MNLRAKLSLLTIFLIFITTLLMGGIITQIMRNSMQREIELRGQSIARTIAQISVDPLAIKDDLYLAQFMKNAVMTEDILYALIIDRTSTIRAHNDMEKWWQQPYQPPPGLRTLDNDSLLSQVYRTSDGAEVADIGVPILSGETRIGELHVGVSRQRLKETLSLTRTIVMVIGLGTLLIGVFGASFLSHFITGPIKGLVEGVKAVAKGNLNYFIKTKSRDEIGTLTSAFNSMVESLREKEVIKDAFRRYVSKQVAEEILKEPEKYMSGLKGEKRKVAVLFADVRGFTPMTERLPAEEVVSILNLYLSKMTDVVFRHSGTLDKFIGDCLMAVFGAPLDLKDSVKRAVMTSIEIQQEVDKINLKRLEQKKDPIYIGIGVNVGLAIAGNIGSHERMDYTVIGDSVNLASRLQSYANEKNIPIIISDEIYEATKDHIVAEELPLIKVKGKEKLVKAYQLKSVKGAKPFEVERPGSTPAS